MEVLSREIDGRRAELRAAREDARRAGWREAEAQREVRQAARARSGVRAHKVFERRYARERAALERVERGEPEHRFEVRVIPFLRAQQQLAQREKAPPRARAAKRRRVSGVPAWSEQTGTSGTIMREFMAEFKAQPFDSVHAADETCEQCGGQMLHVERKATLCCASCGASVPHIDLSVCAQSQRGDVEWVSQSYQRSNHFLEWLNSLQAKESTQVSDEVLRRVMQRLYDTGARATADVTTDGVRQALKFLKMRSQYEHVCQIACRITGDSPPRLAPAIEERLRLMFVAVQEPFERVKGRRKNFLSYSYTLQQFLKLLGVPSSCIGRFAFTLLKGRDKLDRQNEIYEKICRDLDWHFVPLSRGA